MTKFNIFSSLQVSMSLVSSRSSTSYNLRTMLFGTPSLFLQLHNMNQSHLMFYQGSFVHMGFISF